ncbi:MAG: rRNA maturation RNase YbeY [Xanthomonadales bacterium]|nr:rRNA maturation RNase YbeY [Xanthomonadales bacterium]
MAKATELDLQIASDASGLPGRPEFEQWLAAALGDGQPFSLTVRIVDEAEMRALNGRYRGIDKPTNVLSFPADLPDALKGQLSPQPLGDIVICAGVVHSEAGQQGKRPADHWAHLTIHGVLHLLGYDHQDDHDADAMEAREIECLAALGIADPYRQ